MLAVWRTTRRRSQCDARSTTSKSCWHGVRMGGVPGYEVVVVQA